MNYYSKAAIFISIIFIVLVSLIYYPKWINNGTEATISWDVSGYYYYLPAIFIYGDLKKFKFKDEIHQKYNPANSQDQVYLHKSGNYVLKYSCGQALLYTPFFLIAHLLAKPLGYSPDGFSKPYQLAINLGGLLIAFIGLWVLRKTLLQYFGDVPVAFTILILVFGTNYLNYTAIDGAMSHNYLFTLYALIVYFTISFYRSPSISKSIFIGCILGLAVLTRPTDIVLCLIPIFWGISSFAHIKGRITFWKTHIVKLISAVVVCLAVASIQVIYWKIITGEYIVYSYQDQGFSWLNPHLKDGIFSYKAGWLVYTPIMLFALLGFIPLYKKCRESFWAISIFMVVFIYLIFAWDIWWYGGSLGQRAMVQSYAVLAFPLASFINHIYNKRIWNYIFWTICAVFIYYNLWLTHQAHRGGLLDAENMTKSYFWKILGKYEMPLDAKKLLDTDEEFRGARENIKIIYKNDFEANTIEGLCSYSTIAGKYSLCLNKERQSSPVFKIPLSNKNANWIRATATFNCQVKEWYQWNMTQFIIRFLNNDKIVKERMIRVHRLLNAGETKSIFIDVRFPKEDFNKIGILFWNAEGDKNIMIDDLKVEKFNKNNSP